MYATINIPGSIHFKTFGPATRKDCEVWIERTVEKYLETEQLSTTLPRMIITNKEAKKWRWEDGSPIF